MKNLNNVNRGTEILGGTNNTMKAMNTVLNNEEIKGDVKMNNKKELGNGYKYFVNHSAEAVMNRLSKENAQLNIIALDYSIGLTPNFEPGISYKLSNQIIMEGQLTEHLVRVEDNMKIVADFCAIGRGTDEILAFTLNVEDDEKVCIEEANRLINSISESQGSGICIRRNIKTGYFYFENGKSIEGCEVNENEVILEYRYFTNTPSGQGKSFYAYAVKRKTVNGIEDCDCRIEIQKKSSQGAYKNAFFSKDSSWKSFDTQLKAFKAATRQALGMVGSRKGPKTSTYIVYNNIAEGSVFKNNLGNIVDASNSQDGASRYCAETIAEFTNKQYKTNLTAMDFVSTVDQTRGGGTKQSSKYMLREDMVTLFTELEKRENVSIEYVVIKGEKLEINCLKELTESQLEDLKSNIQYIGDSNGMKILNHDNSFDLRILKTAHISKSSLNMVVNISMLLADNKKSLQLLEDKAIKQINNMFSEIGITIIRDENGEISIEEDFSKATKLNNESLLADYVRKCDSDKTLKLLPQFVLSKLNSIMQSTSNLINNLKLEADTHYTVVQADPSVLFGYQLLDENEMYCPDFNAKQAAGVRHPISHYLAVSIFRIITPKQMIRRIENLKASKAIKDLLYRDVVLSKGHAIIPASHFLMEKHDGMDFDIDAMQYILDEDVVEILAKHPVVGSVIVENEDDEKTNRRIATVEENIIKKWQNDEGVLERYKESDTPVINEKMDSMLDRLKDENNIDFKLSNDTKEDVTQTAKFRGGFDLFLDLWKGSALVDSANVGQIATSFYNNALCLHWIKNFALENPQDPTVMHLLDILSKSFKFSGNNEYVPVTEICLETRQYKTSKKKAVEILFRFNECNGSLTSFMNFLEDCCNFNRYCAETSIDAAKNSYYIINLYHLQRFFRCTGSDKNTNVHLIIDRTLDKDKDRDKIKEATALNNNLFGFISNELFGKKEENFFNISLIQSTSKGYTLEEINQAKQQLKTLRDLYKSAKTSKEKETIASSGYKTKKIAEGAIIINDDLGCLKNKLIGYANRIAVLCCTKLKQVILSEEAIDLRKSFLKEANNVLNSLNTEKYNKVLTSLELAYSSMTAHLKECSVENTIKGISTKEYAKSYASATIRNSMYLMCDLRNEELGYLILANMIVKFEKDKKSCAKMNPALTCFGTEIVSALESFFGGNFGKASEQIEFICDGENYLDVKNFEDVEVIAEKGRVITDDYVIFCKDKKATIKGTVQIIDNKAFIIGQKDFAQNDFSKGILIKANNKKQSKNINYDEIKSYKIAKEGKYNKFYLKGVKTNGEEVAICLIDINDSLASQLEYATLDIDNVSLFAFFGEIKSIAINGEEIEAILENAKEPESFIDESYLEDIYSSFDSNINSEAINEAAITSIDNEIEDECLDALINSFGFDPNVIQ